MILPNVMNRVDGIITEYRQWDINQYQYRNTDIKSVYWNTDTKSVYRNIDTTSVYH